MRRLIENPKAQQWLRLDERAQAEKRIHYAHPSALHIWWSRSSLLLSRAVIFASVVADPTDPEAPPVFVRACARLDVRRFGGKPFYQLIEDTPFNRLIDFVILLTQWDKTRDTRLFEAARVLMQLCADLDTLEFHDPFAGGGTHPLEAARLGLRTHGSDLNAVAVLINKALYEIPNRFVGAPPANPKAPLLLFRLEPLIGLAEDFEYYAQRVRDVAFERLASYYPDWKGKPVSGYVWCRTVQSPAEPVEIPLSYTFELSHNRWAKPVWDQAGQLTFHVHEGRAELQGTMSRWSGGVCPRTGVPIPYEYIREKGRAGQLGVALMAVRVENDDGSYEWVSPDEEQLRAAQPEEVGWRCLTPVVNRGLGWRINNYGFRVYGDIWGARATFMINTFIDAIRAVRAEIERDALAQGYANDGIPLEAGGRGARAYSEALALYLSFALSKLINRNSLLTRYHTERGGRGSHTFISHYLSVSWTFWEANPFRAGSGNYASAVRSVAGVLRWLTPVAPAKATMENALALKGSSKLIVTDPPYYNAVGYADLSDFFYIWLQRALGDIFSDLLSEPLTNKRDVIGSFVARRAAENVGRFRDSMTSFFERAKAVHHPDIPIVIYFAHKERVHVVGEGCHIPAWEALFEAVRANGLYLTAVNVFLTEDTNRLRARDTESLHTALVLAFRSLPGVLLAIDESEFVKRLIDHLNRRFPVYCEAGYSDLDLWQVAIGLGMEVFLSCAVKRADGTSLTVRDALRLIEENYVRVLKAHRGYTPNWLDG